MIIDNFLQQSLAQAAQPNLEKSENLFHILIMASATGTVEKKRANLCLNNGLYVPDDEAKTFYKAEMRIDDDEELKKHICAVHTRLSLYADSY